MDLRQSAKQYVEEIYINHKQEDVDYWNNLIDTLFDYVEQSIDEHIRRCKDE